MKMKLLVLLIFTLIPLIRSELKNERNVEIFKKIFKDSVDQKFRPNSGIRPTKVTLTAYATHIGPYSDTYNNIDVWMYFRRAWNDPRLAYDLKTGEDSNEVMVVRGDIAEKEIWTPDTFFSQEMDEEMTPLNFIRISPNGDVLMSEKLKTPAKCDNKNKKWLVGQTRICEIHIESYAMNANQLTHEWKDGRSFGVDGQAVDYMFNLTNVIVDHQLIPLQNVNYSRAIAKLQLLKVSDEKQN